MATSSARREPGARAQPLACEIAFAAQEFGPIAEADLSGLLDRIGDARVVMLGEATHGSAEFYRMRARITRELIVRKGFDIVAVAADWPHAARFDAYVRDRQTRPVPAWAVSTCFPTWVWRNEEVSDFLAWLRNYNRRTSDVAARVGFYGLDRYSLYASMDAVTRYLDQVDPALGRMARERYGCVSPWQGDPATYGRLAVSGRYECREREVTAMLHERLDEELRNEQHDGECLIDAVQCARLAAEAERYYRVMYYGATQSWNLRDSHMFETLTALLDSRGPESRAVVWAHNYHIGDASATEMSARGAHNLGQIARDALDDGLYLVGFGTDRGSVAAALDWGEPMQIKRVHPAHADSYEHVFAWSGGRRFLLPLNTDRGADRQLVQALRASRLQRAIGAIYRPESELASHYFEAVLPRQFDEYVWFAETEPVHPLDSEWMRDLQPTDPFGA